MHRDSLTRACSLRSLRIISELFRTRVLHGRDASTGSPIRQLGSQTLAFLAHNDLYLVAIVRNNANIMMTTAFLSSVRSLSPQRAIQPSARRAHTLCRSRLTCARWACL